MEKGMFFKLNITLRFKLLKMLTNFSFIFFAVLLSRRYVLVKGQSGSSVESPNPH